MHLHPQPAEQLAMHAEVELPVPLRIDNNPTCKNKIIFKLEEKIFKSSRLQWVVLSLKLNCNYIVY